MTAPDLATPVGGWRVWRLGADDDGPVLESPLAAASWTPRTAVTAVCHRGCGDAPAWGCSCGLYAVDDPRRLVGGLLHHGILGCTALWGRVVEHGDGWRGEHSYPLVLFVPSPDDEVLGVPVGALTVEQARRAVLRAARARRVSGLGETLGDALRRRYAVPVHVLPVSSPGAFAGHAVGALAGRVRDECVRGLAARRLGDRVAAARLDRAVDRLLEGLRPDLPPLPA
ncbi:hypothetical protein [Actinomycetospora straminea]|uniref:Uncharacterized protein n=1 Tax=Actinomycetospora straminea TaxID=663607 RepID=A0ABP9EZ87_9PSEU|nr:hypothetical protein [Actinomycetospora straminea]MDD7931811.1 hypothetical protein [Actinomycetospora straminea]